MRTFPKFTWAIFALASLSGTQIQALASDFTLIQIPDPQYYTSPSTGKGGTMAMFNSQITWIKNNRSAYNIAYVAQMGDSVQNGDNSSTASTEWGNASSAMYGLESPTSIPYGCEVGNHDQTPAGDVNGSTTWYNNKFGVSHFSGRGYYGGHYGSYNNNHYDYFTAGGQNYVVIYLQNDTLNRNRATIDNWASGILSGNSSRKGIVVSHYLIDPGVPGVWGTWQSTGSQGQDIYNALRGNPNLFLMMCGHMDGEGTRQDYINGHRITTILADYQEHANGGNGYMRINQVRSPHGYASTMDVTSYSPYLNQYYTGGTSQFTLPLDNADPTSANGLLTVDGRLAMVNVSTNGTVVSQWQTAVEGGWSGWGTLAGQTNFTACTATSSEDSRLQVIALKGTNSPVWLNAQSSAQGAWVGWNVITAQVTNAPPPSGFKYVKAFNFADRRFGVLAISAVDGSVWVISQNTDGSGAFYRWDNLGGTGFTMVDVIRLNNQGLALFGIGTNSQAYYNVQATPGGYFSGWQSMGTQTFKYLRGCSIWYQRLQAVGVGTDGVVYCNGQGSDLGTWSGWWSLAGGTNFTKADPVIAKDQCLAIFGVGNNTHVYINQQTSYGSGFTGWGDIGGAFTSIDGLVYVNDRLACFAHTTGGAQNITTELSRYGNWQAWSAIGGTLKDDN